MLTFNDLLALEGIDTSQVRLVCHQDNRLRPGRLYEAWRNDLGAFDNYQSVQSKNRFLVGARLVSFVVTEARKRCSSVSTESLASTPRRSPPDRGVAAVGTIAASLRS